MATEKELDRFYKQANRLDYNAWKFRSSSERRLQRVDEAVLAEAEWWAERVGKIGEVGADMLLAIIPIRLAANRAKQAGKQEGEK